MFTSFMSDADKAKHEHELKYISKFINDYLERLPYELILRIINKVYEIHLAWFLTLHHLPILRQFVISQFFSDEISLYYQRGYYPKNYKESIEDDEDQEAIDDLNSSRDFYYHDGKLKLGKRKGMECFYYTLKVNPIKRKKQFPFIYRESIKDIINQKDLKFKVIYLKCKASEFFTLVCEKNPVIMNSEKVNLTILCAHGLKKGDPRVKVEKSLNNFTVKIQNLQLGSISLHNLVEVDIMHADIYDWSSLRLGENLRKMRISGIKYLGVGSIKFPCNLKSLSIIGAHLNPFGKQEECSFPSSLTHLNLNKCQLDNKYILGVLLKRLPNLQYLKIRNNYSKIIDSTRKYYMRGHEPPEITIPIEWSWPQDLKVIFFDTDIRSEDKETIKQVVIWPPKLEELKFQIIDLKMTQGLPDTLTKLVLSFNCAANNGIQFKLPPHLTRLILIGFDFEDNITEFPKSLIELQLCSCNNINYFKIRFPCLLKFLSIDSCYFLYPEEYQYWQDLENLTYLSLSDNEIEIISNWIPPPNLIHLCLTNNDIDYRDLLIFGENLCERVAHLVGLYMGLPRIPSNFKLPKTVDRSTLSASETSLERGTTMF
ncbi:hypothetical protein DFJ63DRAFT_247915 [Scheffersomyces coipomensis]|uniref:uncharacterized protein n=1 Tax=Scheffersomyces coipomensis TaxID=1788519 RepID=UPI00315C7DFF